MTRLRCGVLAGAAAVLGAALVLRPVPAASQAPKMPLVTTSVSGVLQAVDPTLNGLIIKSDAGERLGWELAPGVIAEAGKFKPGARVRVIYRQAGASDRAVTAIGFPGAETRPVYVNGTGSHVLLRLGAAVDGQCGSPTAAVAAEFPLPPLGSIMDPAACWCCAGSNETCTLANHSEVGRIILAQCFGDDGL